MTTMTITGQDSQAFGGLVASRRSRGSFPFLWFSWSRRYPTKDRKVGLGGAQWGSVGLGGAQWGSVGIGGAQWDSRTVLT